MMRHAAQLVLSTGLLLATHVEGGMNWMAGAGEALQGLVASVSGTSPEVTSLIAQCKDVPELLTKMATTEYADCIHNKEDTMEMLLWYGKKSFSSATGGQAYKGVQMETTEEEDKENGKLMHKMMQDSCSNKKCMAFQTEMMNRTMGCYLGGTCHMLKNMPDDDEDDGPPNPFKKLSEEKCKQILTKGTMANIDGMMAMACKKENGSDKLCMEVMEVDFIANNPVCYAELAGPMPQCKPSCKSFWNGLSKQYPACTKSIENYHMNQTQNQLKMFKELLGSEFPVAQVPMITMTELCNRGQAAGSSSSVSIQI